MAWGVKEVPIPLRSKVTNLTKSGGTRIFQIRFFDCECMRLSQGNILVHEWGSNSSWIRSNENSYRKVNKIKNTRKLIFRPRFCGTERALQDSAWKKFQFLLDRKLRILLKVKKLEFLKSDFSTCIVWNSNFPLLLNEIKPLQHIRSWKRFQLLLDRKLREILLKSE